MRAKFLAVLLSTLFAVVFMELALRLIYEPAPEWIEPQVRHDRSPLLGWVLPRNEKEAYTIDALVQTNSLGLRDDEIPLVKPEGEVRVLSLGDSFTFALGVEFDDLYVQKLERQLNAVSDNASFQVINAGVAGYNSRQERIYLLAQGLDLDPDLITVGFYWNDLIANEQPLPDLESIPLRSVEPELHGDGRGHALPSWLRNSLRRSLFLYTTVTRGKTAMAMLLGDPPQGSARVQPALLSGDEEFLAPYWEATAEHLQAIAAIGRERGIPVILVAFPMENQIRGQYDEMVWGEKLKAIWAPTGFPLIDLEAAYRDALNGGENPFLPYDLHPGEHGMDLAADSLYEVIVREQLVDGVADAPLAPTAESK